MSRDDRLLENHARGGHVHGERLPDLAGLDEAIDLLGVDVPVLEPPARGRIELRGALGDVGHAASVHRLEHARGEQQLLLGRHELGRVHVE
ncbi:MAG TPA: hypothetical protein VMM35_01305, partial [Longimicrobiales bacterium]|nr:hypothetical protein [Longimicrobiales bacterium]